MRRSRLRAALVAAGLLALAGVAATRPPVLDRAAGWADPSLRAEGLAIGWGLDLSARRIALADAGGDWLTLRDLRLDWSPMALLSGRVVIRALTARTVTLARLPAGGGGSSGGPGSLWQAVPTHVRLDRLAIDRLRLPVGGGTETLRVTSAFTRTGAVARGRLEARVPGGTARYALRARWDPAGLDATLRLVEPAGGMIQRLAGIAATGLPSGGLSVTMRASGPPQAIALVGTVTRMPFSARFAGTLDAGTLRGRLDAAARLEAPLTLAGLRLGAGRLTARLAGGLAAPTGEVTAELDGLTAAGAQASALRASARVADGAARLRGTLTGLRLPGRAAALPGGTLRFRAELSAPPARRLRFRLTEALGTLAGEADPATGALRARLHLPDLAPLAALAGVKAGGAAALRLGAMRAASGLRWRVAGTVRMTAPSRAAALLGPALRLALRGHYGGGRLAIGAARLDAAGLTLRGSGTARLGRIAARLRLGLPELSLLAPGLAGALTFDARLDGPPDALALTGALSGSVRPPEAAACPAAGCALHGRLALTGLPGAPQGTLHLGGALLDAPVALDATLAPGPRLDLTHLAWRSLAAEGTVGRAAGAPRGAMTLRIGRLADLAPFLGRPLAGSLDLKLSARSGAEEASATARGVRLGATRLAAARLRARVTGPAVAARLDLSGLDEGSLAGDATLTAEGKLATPALRLAARLTRGGPGQLTAAARADIAARGLTLTALAASWRGIGLRLRAPLRLAESGGALTMGPLDASLAGGTLRAHGRIGTNLALHAALTGLDLAAADGLRPGLRAVGRIDAAADLAGPVAAPRGQLRLDASGLRLLAGPGAALPPVALHVLARLDGARRQVTAEMRAGASTLALGGELTGPRLALRVDGTLEAALADPLLEASGARVAGRIGVAGRIDGALAAPRVAGTITLTGGSFADLPAGLHLRDVAGRILGSGSLVRITALSARAGAGSIDLSGTLGLGPTLPVALRLTVRNATPIDSRLAQAAVDAALTLDGPLRPRAGPAALLAGSVRIRQATLRIPDALPASVRQIPVRWAGAPPPPPAAPAAAGALPRLDLRITAPGKIFLRGRGVQAEFGGDVRLGGTLADPLPRGGFRLLRGSLALGGQSLSFTSGTVRFTGAGIADPALDLQARATSGDTVASLAITGSVAAPKITLSSVPALPSDQVLARLLFGTGASQLSPLQIASLAAGLAQLSGAGAGLPDPVGALRQALGLSTLGMGNGGSSVTVGRYIGGVYVGAEQSTTGGGTRARVSYDLTKRLRLHASAGPGETSSALGATGQTSGESVGIGYHLAY